MISFANAFLSYLMLFLVIAAVGGIAIAIGITMRKKKNNRMTENGTTSGEGHEAK